MKRNEEALQVLDQAELDLKSKDTISALADRRFRRIIRLHDETTELLNRFRLIDDKSEIVTALNNAVTHLKEAMGHCGEPYFDFEKEEK